MSKFASWEDIGLYYSFISMPISEYESLKQKLVAAEQQIAILNGNADQLRQTISFNQTQIDLFKQENEKLTDQLEFYLSKIDKLTKENKELKTQLEIHSEKIDQLTEKDKESEVKIEILTYEVELLKHVSQKNENTKMMTKLMISMQDLNAEDSLNSFELVQSHQMIRKLKKLRVSECHYIEDIDSLELVKYKKQIIYDKLTTLTSEFKIMFEKKCGKGLIEGIIRHLKNNMSLYSELPTQEDHDDANDWWTE